MGDFLEYCLFAIIGRIAQRLSFRSAGKVGALLGGAAFSLTRFRKAVTLDNLRHAFPEKSEHEIADIARRAYKNYGIALLESMWTNARSADELKVVVNVANAGVLAEARRRGKGVLLLSAHFGSWELLVSGVRLNLDTPLTMIVQRQRNQYIDMMFNRSRSRFGNVTIPMGPSSRKVLTALAENRVVLMLADQSGPKEAVFVQFFGRPAATHRGAAAFSLKTGAPMFLGLLVRQPDGTYTFTLEEVDKGGLDPSSEESIIELTQRHVAVLEKWIHRHPDHWLWMHKRWKHTHFYEAQQKEETEA